MTGNFHADEAMSAGGAVAERSGIGRGSGSAGSESVERTRSAKLKQLQDLTGEYLDREPVRAVGLAVVSGMIFARVAKSFLAARRR